MEGGGWGRRGRRGAPGDLTPKVTGWWVEGETSLQGDRKIVSPITAPFCGGLFLRSSLLNRVLGGSASSVVMRVLPAKCKSCQRVA